MTRNIVVSIAGLHDGIALTEEEAELLVIALENLLSDINEPLTRRFIEQVRNVLCGRMRDGSEPEPMRHQLYQPSIDRRSIEDLHE